MKARINENNQIVVVSELPNKFRNTIGGYNLLPSSVHRNDGWRDVIVPDYDHIMQRLGDLYYDEGSDVFTYTVIDIEFDIAAEKSAKIKQAKQTANALLSKTDWYVIREMERGESVPDEVSAERQAIVNRCNEIESIIDSMTKVRDVKNYSTTF